MQQTAIVGNKEYTFMLMNAFDANRLLMRIQKVATPVIGALVGGGKNMGDMDVKEAARIIAENIDESIMDNIILPMFDNAKVFDCEKKRFIKSGNDINQCFTVETLFDFYELAFHVGRENFQPFFGQIAGRFGNLLGGEAAQMKATAS